MGRRKRNDLNKKLNKILLFMSALLVVLVAIAYVESNILKNDDISYNFPGITDSQNNITPSDVNNKPSESTSTDSSSTSEPDDEYDEKDEQESQDTIDSEDPQPPIVLAFAGDVNFDEDSKPVARYDMEKKGIIGGISQELVDEMNEADIFMLNNEFAYSTRGTEIIEKSYTFRAHPKRVDILKEIDRKSVV